MLSEGLHLMHVMRLKFAVMQVRQLQSIDVQQLQFVGDALTLLRQEVDNKVQQNCFSVL